MKSQFCLFEAGAGWALRTAADFDVVASDAEHVPYFFKTSRVVEGLLRDSNGGVSLTRKGIEHLISVVNTLIEHLNRGRRIKGEEEIVKYDVKLPTDAEIRKAGKTLTDYVPEEIRVQLQLLCQGYKEYLEATDVK